MRPAFVLAPISLALVLSTGAWGLAVRGGQDAAPASAAPGGTPRAQGEPAPAPPAAATPPAAVVFEQGPVDPAVEAKVRERLSRAFAQRTRNLLQRELVFLGLLQCSLELSRLSVELEPTNPALWRLALDLASTMVDGEPKAAEFGSEALARLNELEPNDEVIRLRRLLDTVARRQTAEERIAAYEKLLEPANIGRIGRSVAARIAFDLALLRQRTGDEAGYRAALLQAVDLDATFPEAAEVAAGYFAMASTSPAEHADALRTAVLSNPSRPPAALSLASVCLQNGAYQAGADILALEARLLETRVPNAEYDGLLADLVLAHWGARDTDSAYLVARKRQLQLDAVLHAQLERDGVILDLKRRKEARLPATVTLATNLAAMANARKLPDSAVAVSNAMVSFGTQLQSLDRFEEGRAELARTRLEGAFVQLWLDGDVTQATDWIEQSGNLSDEARARFDGLLKLRAKDPAAAKEILAPVAARDTGARLALAMAQEALGENKEAARAYLEFAKSGPDTAIGLWCRDRLESMLGTPIDLFPAAGEVAKAAALPQAFSQLLRTGGANFLIRIVPRRTELEAWDPVVFDVQLTNRSNWPLAIGRDGPIRDTASVTSSLNIPGTKPGASPFSILQIDRAFRLDPGQTISIPIDLSLTDAATTLRDHVLTGAFASVHTIVNWKTTQMGLEPGPLGMELESPLVHIGGIRVGREWVEQSLAALADRARPVDPEVVAYLAYAVLRAETDPAGMPADAVEALKAAPEVMADAARRVTPQSRAWLVFACPAGRVVEDASEGIEALGGADGAATLSNKSSCAGLEPLDAVLRADESAMTRIAWISLRVRRPEDPMLEASVGSKDERVAAYARTTLGWMNDTQAERRRRLNLAP